ncbi:MAG: hypothetical protein ACQES3_08470, partial [Pseudomonadota bacterium]
MEPMKSSANLVSQSIAQAVALAVLSLSLFVATGAQASPIADEAGFVGEIQPLIGVMSSRSNLAVS